MKKINELICDLYFEIMMFYTKRGNVKASKKWGKIFIKKYNKIHGTNLDWVVKE